MSADINRIADALERRFKQTVAESADMLFEATGVTPPKRSVWEGYAEAVIAEYAPPLPGESNARIIAGPATPSKR
jgi:hypothetical protein